MSLVTLLYFTCGITFRKKGKNTVFKVNQSLTTFLLSPHTAIVSMWNGNESEHKFFFVGITSTVYNIIGDKLNKSNHIFFSGKKCRQMIICIDSKTISRYLKLKDILVVLIKYTHTNGCK